MKVQPPKAWGSLSLSQRRAITEYARAVAREQNEKDGRIMLDLYIKMVCLTLHEVYGFGEKRLYLFLANHANLFYDQRKRVQDGTQVNYLEEQMAHIFRKNGFPNRLFDKMLGPIEKRGDRHMKTIKDICKEYGYTQDGLAKHFDIPLRTMSDWCRGLRTPPPYVVTMLETILRREREDAAKKYSE